MTVPLTAAGRAVMAEWGAQSLDGMDSDTMSALVCAIEAEAATRAGPALDTLDVEALRLAFDRSVPYGVMRLPTTWRKARDQMSVLRPAPRATLSDTLEAGRQAAYLYLCTLPEVRAALAALDTRNREAEDAALDADR